MTQNAINEFTLSEQEAHSFGKVAVMFGGLSAEREVSLASGKAVLTALESLGLDVHGFDPKFDDLALLAEEHYDRVFIVLHGRGGEDGSMQGALQLMNMPFTGSGMQGSAMAMDKVRSKLLFKGADIPTAPFEFVRSTEPYDAHAILTSLGGRVMVKPANEGSSIGMSQAKTVTELEQAIELAFEYDREVLVEQWITGKEITVSILNDRALSLIEMRTPNEFYDYDAKYQSNTTEYLCPAPLSNELTAQIQVIAERAFKLIGAHGWGRVDFLLDEQDNPFVLEINTVPGMTKTSLVPKAAKESGMSFEQLVIEILRGSLA